MWSLRVLTGPQVGKIYDLKSGKNTIGRQSSNDLALISQGISKDHCEIHVYKDKVLIVDLKSSNGTFVNGVKVQNSIVKLGDKISLFDVIMDIIPTPDIRPKSSVTRSAQLPMATASVPNMTGSLALNQNRQMQPMGQISMQHNPSVAMDYSLQDQLQNQNQTEANPSAVELPISWNDRLELFIEKTMMPFIYKAAVIFPFKQVLFALMLLYVLVVTSLSLFPLSTIVQESNFVESSRRAKSLARTVSRINEQALLSGQYTNLSVAEVLKEDGVKEALIIQQSDGAIIAPSEKAGREYSKPFILQARKENRSVVAKLDSHTIAASHPIGVYDPLTGETNVKYHAVVFYEVTGLDTSDERVISLFMQNLVMSSFVGIFLFFILSRIMQHPLKELNAQIDTALKDKLDNTDVKFDYPELQKLVSNVNLLLTRVWSSGGDSSSLTNLNVSAQKENEYQQLVDMLSQPACVIYKDQKIVSVNTQFAQICQMDMDQLKQNDFHQIIDISVVQSLENLIQRSVENPFEKQSNRIPFAQFECEMWLQSHLDHQGQSEYYFVTLVKVEPE